MATNIFKSKYAQVLLACLFLASCGGSGGDSGGEPLPPALSNYNVELFTGKTTINYKECDLAGDTLQTAGFFNLSKIAVYKDSIELLESYEYCNLGDVYFEVRVIKGNTVDRILSEGGGDGLLKEPPVAKYPSGFNKIADNDYFVVGVAAARSNRNFELDAAAVAELSIQKGPYTGWDYFAHGFYRYVTKPLSRSRILAAGASVPPAVVDGQGNGAQFYAPHDLEADAQGLMYTVDKGMVRTISRDYMVKTIPNAEVWVGGVVKALDADRAGMIHVLGRQPDGGYVWSRLMAGKRPEGITTYGFKLRATDGPSDLQTIETFTVVGDSLVVARRNYEAATSELFRVWPGGMVEDLTGSGRIAWPSTGASATTGATGAAATPFPQVQHLEYGVDGHLYIALPQGVLRIKDFK